MKTDKSFKYSWLAKNYWCLWCAAFVIGMLTLSFTLDMKLDQFRVSFILIFTLIMAIAYGLIDRANQHRYEQVVLTDSGLLIKKKGDLREIKWKDIETVEAFPSLKTQSITTYKKVDPDYIMGSTGVRLNLNDGSNFALYRKISGYKELLAIINNNIKTI